MIVIALGANLPTERYGPPVRGLAAALLRLEAEGIRVRARSRPYRSAPVPRSDQPWYVNAVAIIDTALAPEALLARLLAVERAFGRVRGDANAARSLDLDLIDYHGLCRAERPGADGPALVLPHPRLRARAFVLLPLAEIAPDWRHPASGESVATLIARLAPDPAAISVLSDKPLE